MMHDNSERNILFFVPTDYRDLVKKGVQDTILFRDEFGFFKNVISLHPFSSANQVINLNEIHKVVEFTVNKLKFLPDIRPFNWFNLLYHILKIIIYSIRLIKSDNIKIIRSTDVQWVGLIAWISARIMKRPFCISIHADYDFINITDPAHGAPKILNSRKLAKWLETFLLLRADLVMPISAHLKKYAMRSGVKEKNIHIIHHGIDLSKFDAAKEINFSELYDFQASKKILSFAGRFSRQNYVEDVIKVASAISERDDFILIMAGDGEERERLLEYTESNIRLKDIVRFIGFQPSDVIYSLHKQSFISICPLGGFSLIEACAGSCAVIAYDIEWHREVFQNKEIGFLVDEGAVDMMRKKIEYLLDNPEECITMGKRGRKTIENEFTLKKTSDNKIEGYLKILQPS